VLHTTVAGAVADQSPGRRVDLTPFVTGTDTGDTGDTGLGGTGSTGDTGGAVQLLLNELLADPPDAAATGTADTAAPVEPGDANCDGVRDAGDDEFVEIVNTGSLSINLTGAELSDAITVRHVFGSVVLDPGDSVVVFGGGSPYSVTSGQSLCAAGAPAGVVIETASTGSLGLNNGGDSVVLTLGGDTLIDETYTQIVVDQSLTRDPDLTTGPFVEHTTATGASTLYSPGLRTDLSAL
jgi:hypothetical protein